MSRSIADGGRHKPYLIMSDGESGKFAVEHGIVNAISKVQVDFK